MQNQFNIRGELSPLQKVIVFIEPGAKSHYEASKAHQLDNTSTLVEQVINAYDQSQSTQSYAP